MLDNNAIAAYNVFLSNLLRNDRLTSHVSYFKNDVLSAQVQFPVKLDAERAFEYWVRENVPLSRCVDVRQTVRSTVVFAEARTIVVRGSSDEVTRADDDSNLQARWLMVAAVTKGRCLVVTEVSKFHLPVIATL